MDGQSQTGRCRSVRFDRLPVASPLLLLAAAHPLFAQQTPNSNSVYQQMRSLLPGADVVTVTNLELQRDAATFTFTRGDFAFYGEVNGKVTGAVLRGVGHFHLTPPTAAERHNLLILNHTQEFDDDFDEVVLRFTDATSYELHKAATGKDGADEVFARAARDLRNFQRLKLFENIDLRLLEDVMSPAQGGFFLAAIHNKGNPHLIFTIDPHGARRIAPEEVSLVKWNDWSETYAAAFPRKESVASPGEENGTYRITNENLDVTIERSGFLTGSAT